MEHIEETLDLVKTDITNNLAGKLYLIEIAKSFDISLDNPQARNVRNYPELVMDEIPAIEVIADTTETTLAGGARDYGWDDDEHKIIIICHNISEEGKSEYAALRSYRYARAISEIIQDDRTLKGYVSGSETAYASGTDVKLTSPNGAKNSTGFCPVRDSVGEVQLYIGNTAWRIDDYGESKTYNALAGGVYGSLQFQSSGAPWNTFAASTSNGLKTVYLPLVANNDNLGGYFQFYYDQSIWTTGFNGWTGNVVITTDGSVYKGSISNNLLVINRAGVAGLAGGGTYTDAVISWYRTMIDYKPMYTDGNVYKQEIWIHCTVKRNET